MSITPKKKEADVKDALKKYLNSINAWYCMTVPSGMGRMGVHDFLIAYKGVFFSVEAKAPGKRNKENQGASALQVKEMKYLDRTDNVSFLFDGEEDDWENVYLVVERINQKKSIQGIGRKPY
jgi:hypothetical protein